MAKKNKKSISRYDHGFDMDRLLGLGPLVPDKPKKPRLVGRVAKAPVKVVKAPFVVAAKLVRGVGHAGTEVVKLPVRVAGGLAKPWRR